jgi:hypothetical protein
MDLGDIVSTAWALCLRRWQPLLAMGCVTGAASLLLDIGLAAAAQRAQPSVVNAGSHPLPLGVAWFVVVGLPLVLFNQLALIRFSLESLIEGEARPMACYARAARVFRPFLIAALTAVVAFALATFTWILLPVAVYLLVCWFFVGQVYMAEGRLRSWHALQRSRALVRGLWWRTAAILLGLTLLSLLPSLLAESLPSGSVAGSLLIIALASAAAAPFAAASQTLLYLDLRLRKHERIDLGPSRPAEPV